MSLIEYTLDGKVDKVAKAIERIRSFEPVSNGFDDKPYYVCYSVAKIVIAYVFYAKRLVSSTTWSAIGLV